MPRESLILQTLLLMLMSSPGFAQSSTCDDQWPAWSPDGNHIVFSSTRSGDYEIYTLDLRDNQLRQLTDVAGRDAHPSFSPDGTRIAFQSPRGGSDTHLFIMATDGGEVRQVTRREGFSGMPVWSPDGARLAYQWRSTDAGAKWQIMIVRLADGFVSEITPGSANDQVVNWSPDGETLLFHSDRSGHNQIYTWKDEKITRLTRSPFPDQSATWSPSGERIAFVSTRHAIKGVYLMDADGSGQQRVGGLALDHGLPFFSPDGRRLLVTPTGLRGVEIWSLHIETGLATKFVAAC